ncbi:MAG: sporulation membrane protein YtaF [Bacillota bacterium]|jgi:putative sporulation protein YtaF
MIVILGVVVSLDGFAAALSYGAQRIKMSPAAVLVICVMSAGVIYLAMILGHMLSGLFAPRTASSIGAVLLMALGVYVIYQHSQTDVEVQAAGGERTEVPDFNQRPIAQINLHAFGLVIQVLRQPALADRDQSGIISWQEAILLGTALALDAFGAGLGAAMTGLSALPTALAVGAIKFCALLLGWELGYHLQHRLSKKLVVLPGMLLIFLGVFGLFAG